MAEVARDQPSIRQRVHCRKVAFRDWQFLFVLFDELEGHPVHGDYFRVERFAYSTSILRYGSSPKGDL